MPKSTAQPSKAPKAATQSNKPKLNIWFGPKSAGQKRKHNGTIIHADPPSDSESSTQPPVSPPTTIGELSEAASSDEEVQEVQPKPKQASSASSKLKLTKSKPSVPVKSKS